MLKLLKLKANDAASPQEKKQKSLEGWKYCFGISGEGFRELRLSWNYCFGDLGILGFREFRLSWKYVFGDC
jgi:hypothetical protein